MFFISKRTIWTMVALIILVGLFGWAWRYRTSVPFVTRPLVMVSTPFQYGSARTAQEILATADILDGAINGYEEMEQLRRENGVLRSRLTARDELLAENIRLRELLDFRATYPQYTLLGSHVISREYGTWSNTILIDRGENDGVQKYMPVMVPAGLVGFVSDAFPDSARVQLILDPRTAVGGIVQRPESRLAAIVTGSGNDPLHPEMIDIVKEGDIEVGDAIITSGYGGVYPKGILIGTVNAMEPDPSGVVKRAILEPAAPFGRLEEVFVILYVDETVPLAPEELTADMEAEREAIAE